MTLTKAQRKRLAKAARELASDFAEERGPKLESRTWCGCVAARLLERAGIANEESRENEYRKPAAVLDLDLLDGVLTEATHDECGAYEGSTPLPGAVVFPLLWAADELESKP